MLGSTLATVGQARSVAIGGAAQAAAVDSRVLQGTEMLPVWSLPRLGVSVRNDPRDLRLVYGSRELHYAPESGWQTRGIRSSSPLTPPYSLNGSLYVPLDALQQLGVRVLSDTPTTLNFAPPALVPTVTLPPSSQPSAAPALPAPPAPASSPAPAQAGVGPSQGGPMPQGAAPFPQTQLAQNQLAQNQPSHPVANLNSIRVSHTLHRNVEVQRVVMELTGPAAQTITRQKAGLSILLGAVSASAVSQTLQSGELLSVTPGLAGATVQLPTGGGVSEVFTLDNPARVVVDTTTLLSDTVPPPINSDSLPSGVTYSNRGTLHLLSFDPARYQARVVNAPSGKAADLATLVKSVGGVAGVNGGYFDTASFLPVDLIVKDGLMVSPSLERRATVGFTAAGDTLFGYPRPRYVLSGPFGSMIINTVGAKVRHDLLCAFVGDGQTAVGTDGLTTLYLSLGGSAVQNALTGRVVPPAGTLAVTFDPARFPQLPRTAGQPLNTALAWNAADAPWDTVQDALSAGPLLVSGGRVALNPAREKFDTLAGIWRPTRQVAVGTLDGKPTLAYFEYGTPEAFAAALAAAGVRDAVRMDSGSSASVYTTSGFANLGGYLNTVWSQRVPNAIVFVPRTPTARAK